MFLPGHLPSTEARSHNALSTRYSLPAGTQPDFLSSIAAFCICGGLFGAFGFRLGPQHIARLCSTCLSTPSALSLIFHNGHSSRPISTVIAHIPLTGFNVTHIRVAPAMRQAPCLHWGRGKPWSSPTTCSLEGRRICKSATERTQHVECHEGGVLGASREEATSELCF